MNKKFKNFLQIVFIVLSLVGFADILTNFHYGTAEHIEVLHKPVSISGSTKFIIADNIYIGNIENSSIQVFDSNGKYIYGLRLPTSGGDFWMCRSEEYIYIYIIRNGLLFKLFNQECIEVKEHHFNKKEDFYKESNFNPTNNQISLSIQNKLTIKDIDSDTKRIINIEAPIFPLSIFYGFAAMAVGLLGIFVISGYFSKFLQKDNPVENNEVVKFFRNYKNKLK